MGSESSSCCWIAALAPSIGNAHHERPALLRHLRRRFSSSRTERSLKREGEACVRGGGTY